MTYQEFTKNIEFGNTTAFVYDAPNNRYNYSSGEIYEKIFDNTTSETDFRIAGIDEYPEVKQVIIDNFLSDIAPAANVQDDGYDSVKKQLVNGKAKLGIWKEKNKSFTTTTTYMLILVDQEAEEVNVLVEYAANLCGSERVAKIFCKEVSEELSNVLGDFNREWEEVKVDEDGPTKEQDEELDTILEEYQRKINAL